MNRYPSLCGSAKQWLLTGVCVLAAGSAFSAELDAAFNTSIGRSDNILRTENNQVEETMATVGVELALLHGGPKLSADVFVNADYIDYIDDSFDSDLQGGATAIANYWFLGDRLGWNLQYNFGQQVFDPLAPVRPDNRENVSYLTTGPTLEMPLGPRFEFTASVDYSNTSYEINPNDQQRYGGRVSIGRLMSAGRTLSLVSAQERVEYDLNTRAPDFDSSGVFLRFESANTRGSFTFDLGVNKLELDGVDRKSDGTLVRLDWTRMVSDGVEISIGAGSRYSDQGDIFRFFQNASFDLRETEDVAGEQTPFRNNYGAVTFSLDKARTAVDFVVIYNDEDYELDSTFDRVVKQLNFLVSRDFTQSLFGEVGVNASSRKFALDDVDFRDTQYTLTLGYRFTEAISTSLSYQYFERSTSEGLSDFDENRIFLRLSYVPRWSRQ